jgi:hypothetical protein
MPSMPPGAELTTTLIGRDGYVSAHAVAEAVVAAVAAAVFRNVRLRILMSFKSRR